MRSDSALARIGFAKIAIRPPERFPKTLRARGDDSISAGEVSQVEASGATASKLPAPDRELGRIERLSIPCREGADWAERAPDEFLDYLLGPVSSIFARLTILAIFLDRETGRYVVPLAGSKCQCPVISDVLHAGHERLLNFWLSLSLSLKAADLALYLSNLDAWPGASAEVAANKIRSGDLIGITPLNADPAHIGHLVLDAGLCMRCLVQTRRR